MLDLGFSPDALHVCTKYQNKEIIHVLGVLYPLENIYIYPKCNGDKRTCARPLGSRDKYLILALGKRCKLLDCSLELVKKFLVKPPRSRLLRSLRLPIRRTSKVMSRNVVEYIFLHGQYNYTLKYRLPTATTTIFDANL